MDTTRRKAATWSTTNSHRSSPVPGAHRPGGGQRVAGLPTRCDGRRTGQSVRSAAGVQRLDWTPRLHMAGTAVRSGQDERCHADVLLWVAAGGNP
jgi:hypothetical protein